MNKILFCLAVIAGVEANSATIDKATAFTPKVISTRQLPNGQTESVVALQDYNRAEGESTMEFSYAGTPSNALSLYQFSSGTTVYQAIYMPQSILTDFDGCKVTGFIFYSGSQSDVYTATVFFAEQKNTILTTPLYSETFTNLPTEDFQKISLTLTTPFEISESQPFYVGYSAKPSKGYYIVVDDLYEQASEDSSLVGTKTLSDSTINWLNVNDYGSLCIGLIIQSDGVAVKTPVITFENRNIEIKCDIGQAKIMYTLDGSEPTAYSTYNCFEYAGPFIPESDCMIKARAFKTGWDPSEVAQYIFNRETVTVKTPKIAFVNRMIEIEGDTEEAKIMYTLDGSEPSENKTQNCFEYSGSFLPEADCTIKAAAFKENMFPSDIAEYAFNREIITVKTPTIIFKNRMIDISCDTEDVRIMFTFNGSEPTENSSESCFEYTGPFLPNSDCTINAVAFKDNKLPSARASYIFSRDAITVKTPLITFKNRLIEINCNTEDSRIMYTLDGSEPTESGSDTCFEYTSAFLPSSDCTIKAAAFKENMLNSGIFSFTYNKEAFTVNTPSIIPDFSGHRIVIDHSIASQSIRVITTKLDESASEQTGKAPFEMGVTTNMKSISVMALGEEDLFDSEPVSFVIKFVKTPTFHVMDEDYLEIFTEPSDARIYYTVDGSTPSQSSMLYTTSLGIDDDLIVKAIGVKDNYFDSPVASFRKDYNLSVPTASVMNKQLILSSNENLEDLRILYSLDGSDPLYGSEYTEPIKLPQHNITVTFIAVHPEKYNSAVGQFNFIVADYTAEIPVLEYEYDTRGIIVRHEQNGYPLNMRIIRNDGSEFTQEVNAPYYLNVESNMTQISVNAAETSQLFASASVESPIEFTQAPTLSFDGNYLGINLNRQDDNTIIRLGLDGYENTISGENIYTMVSSGQKIQLNLLGSIVGVAYSNSKFFSDPNELIIDAWFDGKNGATRVSGALQKALQWCGTDLNPFIRIEGPLNESDFATIRSCNGIRILALDSSSSNNEIRIPFNAFAGTKIRWIVMEGGNVWCDYGAFGSADELSFLYWKPSKIPQNSAFSGVANPNFILFTFVDEAPKDLDVNVVNNNKNDNLELVDGYTFDIRDSEVYWNSSADKISFTRDFFQKTEPKDVRGWETIALPFSPTEIIHKINGKCAPFTDTEAISAGAKPFWLYSMTEDNQFESADHIEAFKPYLISMPNNEAYADRYILGGKVTFSASNVELGPQPDDSERVARVSFASDDLGDGAFTLNVSTNPKRHNSEEIVGGEIYGSVFLQGHRPLRPFEGYFATNVNSNASRIPVFGSLSSIELPNVEYSSKYELSVFVENRHVQLLSEYNRTVVITDMTGQMISKVETPAGVMTDAGQLAPGIYIIGNQKIMIR